MARAVAKREDLPVEYTWDLASIFPSESDWDAEVEKTAQMLQKLDGYRGRLAESGTILLEALETIEQIWTRLGHVFAYASMLRDQDTTNQAAAAKDDRAMGLYSQVSAATAFVEPEILAIGASTLQNWMNETSGLEIYGHYFDHLEQQRAHIRSPEVEQILGMALNPFGTARQIHGTLADADLTFAPAVSSSGDRIDLSQGNIDALITDSDREVRRTAFEHYADAHLALQNTMGMCLATGVKQDVFSARVRGYQSSLEAALHPYHLPVEAFHNLVDAYKRHLPTWHRYWRLRREMLGYDTFHVYDIKAPMTVDPPQVPYQEAVRWIVDGMAPLGREYAETMQRGATNQRWVDIYPNEGKRAGAYSGGWQGTHPFILMSYTDDIFSMSTLAHELGHSMHSYYTWRNQPPVYARYSTFVAEVASNFNQALVRDHLLKSRSDRNFQIALIEEAMANFHRYFFIMPALARFELELHERSERDEPLTAEVMNAVMADLFAEGYGSEVEMDRDRIGITWAEFPTHLYMNFYVFQYATGISAAHALVHSVLSGGEEAADRYLQFLKAGDSLYPLDALRLAGVDMTRPEPVEQAFAYLGEMVDRLGELVREEQSAGVS